MRTQKNNSSEIMNIFSQMSEIEKKDIIDQILCMMKSPIEEPQKYSCESIVKDFTGERPNCPYCRAESSRGLIVKKGLKNGTQRYLCKECGKLFVATTNTAFSRTRKSSVVWSKFIEMTISGDSIEKCAVECGIAHQTAFTWRHKVLNVFVSGQSSAVLNSVVEADEMLIPISFKGNHVKGAFHERRHVSENGMNNGLPRASFKRGSDNKSMSSKDKACVFCMVDRKTGTMVGTVPGVGFMLPNMLDATLAKHVNKEKAMVLVDQYKVTRTYLEDNGYNHMTLASNVSENYKDHKPEIRGEYHLQHVNSMHHHFRVFMKDYHGVSSKYLAHYVALFTWLKNAKTKNDKKLREMSLSRATYADCYIPKKVLDVRPAIPCCA